MRYMLAYMLEGDAKAHHLELSDRLAERFRLRPVSRKNDPHITLKAPFDTEDIHEIDNVVTAFTQKESPEELAIGGFDLFPKRVVYMNVRAPKQTHMLVRRLQDQLRNVAWLPFGPKEFPLQLHATLCYAKKPEQTKEILSYLKKEKPREFHCQLDAISLLEKHERWEVAETYWIETKKYRNS